MLDELRNWEPPSEVHASTKTTIASGHSPAANISSMRSTLVGSNAVRPTHMSTWPE